MQPDTCTQWPCVACKRQAADSKRWDWHRNSSYTPWCRKKMLFDQNSGPVSVCIPSWEPDYSCRPPNQAPSYRKHLTVLPRAGSVASSVRKMEWHSLDMKRWVCRVFGFELITRCGGCVAPSSQRCAVCTVNIVSQPAQNTHFVSIINMLVLRAAIAALKLLHALTVSIEPSPVCYSSLCS